MIVVRCKSGETQASLLSSSLSWSLVRVVIIIGIVVIVVVNTGFNMFITALLVRL
jgi:hypothetical protein